MVLSGSLSDFTLPDVFELIRLSCKTGVLRIQRADSDGSIWFSGGEIFFATSDLRRELLGERLVAAGQITVSALARVLDIRTAEPVDGRRIGAILVDEGYLSRQALETFVREQIEDTIFDLMRWEEGQFSFEPLSEMPADEDIGLSISAVNLVVESARRAEEWNRIRGSISSMDAVYRMTATADRDVSLTPAEWRLIVALDGARSVDELVTATGSSDFDVARSLYGLAAIGLVEVSDSEQIAEARLVRQAEQARTAAEPKVSDPVATPFASEPIDDYEAATFAQIESTVMADEPSPPAAVVFEDGPSEPSEPAEPEMMHLGMGDVAALGDELTALTGASRPRRSNGPAHGTSAAGAVQTIRRDGTVDRATVERVIAGLERL